MMLLTNLSGMSIDELWINPDIIETVEPRKVGPNKTDGSVVRISGKEFTVAESVNMILYTMLEGSVTPDHKDRATKFRTLKTALDNYQLALNGAIKDGEETADESGKDV